jgi:hypothetical protein
MTCSGFKVIQLEEDGTKFTVLQPGRNAGDGNRCYTIDVLNKCCNCGVWQDHGIPCIHAMGYYKLHKGATVEVILAEQVPGVYTYKQERMMLQKNVVPVCMDSIHYDETTLPPDDTHKRIAGRPKTKRIRKRSRHAYEPERSNIRCSRCHKPGHNVRTCLDRETLTRPNSKMDNRRE